jgi:hypothetical protein
MDACQAGAGDDVFDGDAAVAGQQPAPEFALLRVCGEKPKWPPSPGMTR